jgi:hypothetical protein
MIEYSALHERHADPADGYVSTLHAAMASVGARKSGCLNSGSASDCFAAVDFTAAAIPLPARYVCDKNTAAAASF